MIKKFNIINAIPLDKECKKFSIKIRIQKNIGAAFFRTNQSIHITGCLPEDLYPIVYLGKSKGLTKWYGNAIDKNTLVTKGDQNFVYDLTYNNVDTRFILISKKLLLEQIKQASLENEIDLSNKMFFIEDRDIITFLDIHSTLLEGKKINKEFFYSFILNILKKPIKESSSHDKSYYLVKEVVTIMNQNIKTPILMSEIAEIMKLSLRSIELAFKKELNISPKRYYQRLLMQSIESELRQRDKNKTTVSSILENYEIYALSEFGLSFKNYFKKTPSQTCSLSKKSNPFGWNEGIFSEFFDE